MYTAKRMYIISAVDDSHVCLSPEAEVVRMVKVCDGCFSEDIEGGKVWRCHTGSHLCCESCRNIWVRVSGTPLANNTRGITPHQFHSAGEYHPWRGYHSVPHLRNPPL